MNFSFNQVTVIQGDAADETAIQGLVSRVVKEEGHLDVFFANVSSQLTLNPQHIHKPEVLSFRPIFVHPIPKNFPNASIHTD